MTVKVHFENPITGYRWDFGANSQWETVEDARRDLTEQGYADSDTGVAMYVEEPYLARRLFG